MVSATFAVYLFTAPDLEWTRAFEDFGLYAGLDGILALILAAVMASDRATPATLTASTVVDGILRLALAIVTWFAPGVPYLALTTMLFFATISAVAVFVGVAWGVVLLRTDVEGKVRRRIARWPLALASAASLLFGAALFFAAPGVSRRFLLATYALALGLAFMAAAWHHRPASQR